MKPSSLYLTPLFATFFAPVTALADAQASGAENNVEEIIVTANRREQPLSQVGSSVSVISDTELEKKQHIFVLNALESVPGVAVSQTGAFGGTASVSIRGAGGNNSVLLIDGIQLNDASSPGGAYDFGTLDTAGIARIEILRGPQSVLYGSDAIGGVINIITKTGEDGFGGQLYGEYGSFKSFRAGAQLRGGSPRFGYNLSVSATSTDGISAAEERDGNNEKDCLKSYALSGKITSKLSDTVQLELIGRFADNRVEFDDFGPVDGNNVSRSDEMAIAGRSSVDLFDGALRNVLSVEYSDINRRNEMNGLPGFEASGERFNLDYIGTLDLPAGWSLTTGAQRELTRARSVSSDSFTINSLFGELGYAGIKGLTLSAGMRYDDHETFGSATTGRITGSYSIEATGTRFIANWGEGFKAPSIFQLTYICSFCGLSEPSSDLRPERATGYELGIEQQIDGFAGGRITLAATYFYQKSTDLIDFTFSDGYANIASSRSKGVELTLDAVLGDTLELTANYTRLLARNISTDVPLSREPENAFSATLNWSPAARLGTSLSATYNGREFNSFGAGVLDSWFRLDMRAAYEIADGLSLYGRVENVFNAEYQHVAGFGTPDRSAYIGIRKNF